MPTTRLAPPDRIPTFRRNRTPPISSSLSVFGCLRLTPFLLVPLPPFLPLVLGSWRQKTEKKTLQILSATCFIEENKNSDDDKRRNFLANETKPNHSRVSLEFSEFWIYPEMW